jgi:hypothetical protein
MVFFSMGVVDKGLFNLRQLALGHFVMGVVGNGLPNLRRFALGIFFTCNSLRSSVTLFGTRVFLF